MVLPRERALAAQSAHDRDAAAAAAADADSNDDGNGDDSRDDDSRASSRPPSPPTPSSLFRRYHWVVRSRWDIGYVSPLPPLAALSAAHVHVPYNYWPFTDQFALVRNERREREMKGAVVG